MENAPFSHLVFYDGQCGLCDHTVQFLIKADHKKIFQFAPLQGTTAAAILKEKTLNLPQEDSLVLVENYKSPERKFYMLGKAILRICWLLGGGWCLIGWLSYLPSWPFDTMYRVVAKNRHRFFSHEACVIPNKDTQDRFLP